MVMIHLYRAFSMWMVKCDFAILLMRAAVCSVCHYTNRKSKLGKVSVSKLRGETVGRQALIPIDIKA